MDPKTERRPPRPLKVRQNCERHRPFAGPAGIRVEMTGLAANMSPSSGNVFGDVEALRLAIAPTEYQGSAVGAEGHQIGLS